MFHKLDAMISSQILEQYETIRGAAEAQEQEIRDAFGPCLSLLEEQLYGQRPFGLYLQEWDRSRQSKEHLESCPYLINRKVPVCDTDRVHGWRDDGKLVRYTRNEIVIENEAGLRSRFTRPRFQAQMTERALLPDTTSREDLDRALRESWTLDRPNEQSNDKSGTAIDIASN